MEHGDVIEMLDTLYSMIAEAWGVPLGNDKCIIEREKALDIINEIKATMPSSLAEANRLVQHDVLRRHGDGQEGSGGPAQKLRGKGACTG